MDVGIGEVVPIHDHEDSDNISSIMVSNSGPNCTRITPECYEYLYTVMIPLKRYMGYGQLMWFGIGVFGNILSAIVWTSSRMRKENSSAIYLAALSITDLFTLTLSMVVQLSFHFGINTYSYPVICETIFIPQIGVQHLSTTLVLAFTIERWIAICFPFRRDSLCTPRRAVIVVITLTIMTLAVFSVYGYLLYYDPRTKACEVRQSELATLLMTYVPSINEFVFSFGVPICTLIFNLLVIRELQRIAARSQASGHLPNGAAGSSANSSSVNFKSTTAMLLSVSFFLIITALPEGASFALQHLFETGPTNLTIDEIKRDHRWNRHLQYYNVKLVTGFISQSHYACNFIIYLCTGRLYRAYVMKLFYVDRCMRLRGFHGEEYRSKFTTAYGPLTDRNRQGNSHQGDSSLGGDEFNSGGRDSRKRSSGLGESRRQRRGQFLPSSSNTRKSMNNARNNSNSETSKMTYV